MGLNSLRAGREFTVDASRARERQVFSDRPTSKSDENVMTSNPHFCDFHHMLLAANSLWSRIAGDDRLQKISGKEHDHEAYTHRRGRRFRARRRFARGSDTGCASCNDNCFTLHGYRRSDDAHLLVRSLCPPSITRLHGKRLLAPRGNYLLGGGDAGEKGAMRGGIVVLRTCFATARRGRPTF